MTIRRARRLTTHTDGMLLRLEDQPPDSGDAKTAKAALRAKFVAYELPADFVAHLRATATPSPTPTRPTEAKCSTA